MSAPFRRQSLRKLQGRRNTPKETAAKEQSLAQLVELAAAEGATELHLKVPAPPLLRVDGKLLPTRHARLTPQDTHRLANDLFALAGQERTLKTSQEHRLSFGLSRIGRFHAHLYLQRGSWALAIQACHTRVPTLADLGVPAAAERFVGQPGVVLVGGKRREALKAALVQGYNSRTRGHVTLLERELLYLHRDAMAVIAQREVGTDVTDLVTGIQGAVHCRSDLVVVGDVTDAATAKAVLDAAEDGVAVLATVGAPEAERCTEWFTRLFLGSERAVMEERLEHVLLAALAFHPPQILQLPRRLDAARKVGP